VRYIGINQREDSVSYARSSTEQSARIRDYRVYVSADGANWGNPVATGTLPSYRGVAFVDIPATTTRHVRLEVVNTYAASSDSTRYKRLRIDEAWIGGEYAGADGGPGPTSVEAESGTLSGKAVSAACAGCSGGAKVRFIGNGTANYATVTVQAAAAGARQLTVQYTVDGTRSFFLSVNGATATEIPLTGASWDAPANSTVTVTLAAGANTIKFFNDGANAPDLDKITVS
jgi:alpha-L-fucosidase